MFGETAGIHCTSIAFLTNCFSAVTNVLVWKPFDLDYILYYDDNLMKSLKVFQTLAIDEIQLSVNVEGCCIKVRKLIFYNNVVYDVDLFLYHKQMTESLGNGAIFICAVFSFALIMNKNSEFVFDSHSRDRNDCHVPNGQLGLLELRLVSILNYFIIEYYWEIINKNLMSLQHNIQYIEVDIYDADIGNTLLSIKCQ